MEKKKNEYYASWSINRDKENEIETKLINRAREIKNTLNILLYDKRDLRLIVNEIKGTPETFKLSDEQVHILTQTYQSTDKRDAIPAITLTFPNMSDLYNQTKTILQKIATAKIMERLKEDPVLETWVRNGKKLHDGKSVCQFCGSQLPHSLLSDLNKHFSDEYNCLMTDIERLIISTEDQKINPELPDKAMFYLELQTAYKQPKENFKTAANILNQLIDKLLKKLEAKKAKPFESVTIEKFKEDTKKLESATNAINKIIQQHNEKTDKFTTARTNARDKLIKHWASEFATEVKYEATLKKIKETASKIDARNNRLAKIEMKIQPLEEKLSDAVKGSEKINEYIHRYFRTDEIRMEVAEDKKHFKLKRSGRPAKNLSEGEKTVIAFSFFMAKLEENNNDLSQTIVFIDDPVSSLDSNHLFHTYSFIKTKLGNCKQLFISTHNYEFFNLIKEWFKKVKKKDGDKSFYLVEKIKNGNSSPLESNLSELPKPLSTHRSEYVYLFSLLHKFNEDPQPDYDYLYILPNIVRRYLEAYVGFRSLGGLSKNLSVLIEKDVEREKVYKLINTYSHNNSSPRLLHFPDFSECKDVVKHVVDAVRDKDGPHYDALVGGI